MERHKCKLCARTFANGRALGGHMKAHLATLPLPPKTATIHHYHQQQQLITESASSSYSSSGEEQEQEIKNNMEAEDKALVYGLRENPKKSFKLADPEFSFAVDAASVVVQGRESETESRNPTRRRSKRTRKSGFFDDQKQNSHAKKLNLKNPSASVVDSESPSPSPSPSSSPSPLPPAVEPEPVSSVSDTSPDEDVAMCLMMLSRDVWMGINNDEEDEEQVSNNKDGERSTELTMENPEKEEINKASKIRGKLRCDKCMKLFRSSQALVSHKKICSLNGTELSKNGSNQRIFLCPYCSKVFGSGQALGGHKRSHLMGSSTNASASVSAADDTENSYKHQNNLIDLNLPAPMDDDDFSVVSDA